MTQTIAPRVRTLVLLFLAVTGALLAGAAPASAHAALTGSDPARRGGGRHGPRPGLAHLLRAGRAWATTRCGCSTPRASGWTTASPANAERHAPYAVRLLSGLPDGTYTVAWQVVSADSHPVAGAFTFSIGAPSKTTVSVPAQDGRRRARRRAVRLRRGTSSYAGFVVLSAAPPSSSPAGGAAPGCGPCSGSSCPAGSRSPRPRSRCCCCAAPTRAPARLGDVFDLALLGDVLQTKTGAALVSRLLLLAAAALFIAVLFGPCPPVVRRHRDDGAARPRTTRRRRGEAGPRPSGSRSAGPSWRPGSPRAGRCPSTPRPGLQPGIAMPVDVVHLLAVAAWLGGLAALLVALYRAPAETPVGRDAVRRFSRLAFGSVIALVVTGSTSRWRQLGSWSALHRHPVRAAAARQDRARGGARRRRLPLAAVDGAAGGRADGGAGRGRPERARGAPGRRGRGVASAGKASVSAGADPPRPRTLRRRATGSGDRRAPAGSEAGGTAGAGSVRAAQLARQRAAVETARQKRLRDADPAPLGPAPLRAGRGGRRRRPARRHHRADPDRAGAHGTGGQGGRRLLVVLGVRADRSGHRRDDAEHAVRHRRRKSGKGVVTHRPRARARRRQRHARLCGAARTAGPSTSPR